MLRPTRILAQFVAPWIALTAIFAFVVGASLFSEPSDCFRYGEENRSHEDGRADASNPNAARSGHDNETRPKPASTHHECKPYWGPEWSLVWASIGLIFVTSGLAFYTAFLYWTTREIAQSRENRAHSLSKPPRNIPKHSPKLSAPIW